MPKHIAVSLDYISDWIRRDDAGINEPFKKYFDNVIRLIDTQVKSDIPIFTIYLLPENAENADNFVAFCDYMADFFSNLSHHSLIVSKKIKISVFGRWYKLPGKTVESLKKIVEGTKEYDSFFTSFCINYDGQEEIVDACKVVAKQVELGKIDTEMITKESIKENVYSSYFMPPDVMLIYGDRKLKGFLLWDSAYSTIVFAGKSFMEFDEADIQNL